jgi:hypothetical protein
MRMYRHSTATQSPVWLCWQARELEELACIYVERGLPYHLARKVAKELSERDVIRAHAQDELSAGRGASGWMALGHAQRAVVGVGH